MKTVWFGIFGLMAAFTAVVAWYAYERSQTPEPAGLQAQKAGEEKAQDKLAAVKKPAPVRETAKPAPAQPPEPAKPEARTTPEPSVPASAKPDEPESTPAPKAKTPEPVRPSFDVVRVEPDGSAVIAGRAMPGWAVKVQLQGKTIGEAVANKRGEWVIITETPVPYGASSMQLSAVSPDMMSTATSSQVVSISRPREPKIAALPAKTPDAGTEEPAPEEPVAEKPVTEKPAAAKPAPELNPLEGGDTAKSAPSAATGDTGATDKPAAAVPPETVKPAAETARPKAMKQEAASAEPAPESPETEPGMKKETETEIAKPAAETGNAGKPEMPATKTPAAVKVEEPAGEKPLSVEKKPAAVAKAETPEPEQKPEIAAMKKPEPAKPEVEAPPVRDEEKTVVAEASPAMKTGKAEIEKPVMDAGKEPESKPEPESADTGREEGKPAEPAPETMAEKPEAEPLVVVSEPGKPSKVLQSSETGQATKVLSFRAVDYNDDGQVILSGRAEKGSNLRIYLNNDYIGNTTASDKGEWVLKTRKHINPGKYTLRVDQLGPANRIAARVEAPFERAAPAAVAQARINGEVVIQPGDNLWNLSRAYYGSGVQYTIIYEANKNKIKDPDFIYPGQIFTTPDSDPAAREAEREALRQKMLRRR